MPAARVIIATLGSLGDLLPMLAIATALRQRDVDVVVATSPRFRQTVLDVGHAFAPIGGDDDPMQGATLQTDASIDFIDRANFTQLDVLFDTLLTASAGARVIVAPHHVVPAHLVAEKLDIPYVACAFSPAYLLGADSSGDAAVRVKTPMRWHTALSALRRRIDLPRSLLPYSDVFNRAACLLGLFPRFLLPSRVPMTATLEVVGYPVPPAAAYGASEASVSELCDDDTVVFSFGSYADRALARSLFVESAAACQALGLKCLYLSRFVPEHELEVDTASIRVRQFIPHNAVFPHAAVVVHHGGLGTLMSACRAAKPMVIVPFYYDQPYHALRMNELIGAPGIPAPLYDRQKLGAALHDLLANRDRLRQQTQQLMAHEVDGSHVAADRICSLLNQQL